MRAQLFRVHYPVSGRKIILEKGLILGPESIIGRGMSSHFRVGGPNVAERHAQVSKGKDGLFRILHLGEPSGANVTLVNGKEVKRSILLPGDEISFPGNPELFKFTTRSERVAVLMNDGTEEHISRVAKFAVQLEKRGFSVILLTPALVDDREENPECLESGITLKWKIDGESFKGQSDYRLIGEWLEPFTSKYNMVMDYLLVLVSRSRVGGDCDIFPQIAEIVSRVQAAEKVVLSRGLPDSPSSKWKPVLVGDQDIDNLTTMMNGVLQRFGRKSYNIFELPDRDGKTLMLPTREDRIF